MRKTKDIYRHKNYFEQMEINKTHKIILLIILSVFFINCVTAQDYIPHKKNTDWDVVVSSNNATGCNITYVQSPSGVVTLFTGEMTKTVNDFNYTLDKGNFSTNGDVCVGLICTDSSQVEVGNICRSISPTGQEITDSQGFVSLGLMLGVVAVAFLFMWFSFKFAESDKLYPIALFFMVISLLLAVYSIYLGYIFTESILFPMALAGGQSAIFLGLLWGMVALILIGMIFLTVRVIKELQASLKTKPLGEYTGEGVSNQPY